MSQHLVCVFCLNLSSTTVGEPQLHDKTIAWCVPACTSRKWSSRKLSQNATRNLPLVAVWGYNHIRTIEAHIFFYTKGEKETWSFRTWAGSHGLSLGRWQAGSPASSRGTIPAWAASLTSLLVSSGRSSVGGSTH